MKRKRLVIRLGILLLILFALNSTPEISIRTYAFLKLHPILALTSGIEKIPYNQNDKTTNLSYYMFTGEPTDPITKNELPSFEVTKFGLLYFTKYFYV